MSVLDLGVDITVKIIDIRVLCSNITWQPSYCMSSQMFGSFAGSIPIFGTFFH